MGQLRLSVVLLVALLVQDAGAVTTGAVTTGAVTTGAVTTGAVTTDSWNSLSLCETCSGSCDMYNGCSCANGFDLCLPSESVSCNDFASNICCPPGLYYSTNESRCTETPTCFPECAADEVCNITGCVCNVSLYQNNTIADFHPIESCNIDAMFVTVSSCLLSVLGYDPLSIHLRDPAVNCTFYFSDIINGQQVYMIQAKTTEEWCGNTVTKDGSRIYVSNSININGQQNADISIQPITFNITCPLFSVTNPIAQTLMISGVNHTGLYPLTMAAYNDSDFMNPYTVSELVLGSNIYVALYVFYTDGDYVLRVQDCVASPRDNRSDPMALHLVSDGCPTNNLTRIEQNGMATEVRMDINSSQFRDFTKLTLFCAARFCLKGEEECTACKDSQSFTMNVTELQLSLMVKGNRRSARHQLSTSSWVVQKPSWGPQSRYKAMGGGGEII